MLHVLNDIFILLLNFFIYNSYSIFNIFIFKSFLSLKKIRNVLISNINILLTYLKIIVKNKMNEKNLSKFISKKKIFLIKKFINFNKY